MTTAARPTFEPARGGQGRNEKDLSAISRQYSSRDLPGHTKLKYREHGQGTVDETRSRDFRKELEEREREKKTRRPDYRSHGNPLLTHYSSGSNKTDHKVKRRWDDDVVFKNCAKSEPERKMTVFINDSLRSEFHKKFMEKYVK
ncbi:hypothetical protein NQ317_010018 [Molorchus minor]|uniref:Uncharacterized protein n=1 Tax=Molorchus minor TaxID=1323400 RepID=A0ABQ9IT53_9CUCU|nr:hypothetical protein NQ317_010018 [Molorchus minor]